MNIGIVSTWFERGAAYVSKQYRNTLIKDHKVLIYVRGGEKYARNNPDWEVDNLHWGKENPLFLTTKIDLKDFRRWLITNEIELVIFNEQHQWDPVVLCNELNIITGSYIDYYQEGTVELHRIFDFLLCNTRRHFSVFNWHQQAYYIPWGTETKKFKPIHKLSGNKNNSVLTFFHSCGMSPKRKGTDLILEAVNEIKSKEFKLIIHSQVDLKQELPRQARLIGRMEKHNLLQIINKTVTAPGLYYMGDVYVYPTRLEGIGLTIAEALASGLPVITTNQAPMNEFVINNINGKLVEVDIERQRSDNYYWPLSICNVQSLAQSLEWYIQNSTSIKKYKTEAREYAETFLDWNLNSKSLGDLLNRTSKIPLIDKKDIIEKIALYERNRPLMYYLNTFKPYRSLKQIIKRVIPK